MPSRNPWSYTPAADRYDSMVYKRCGTSGLKLPRLSLGLWHNFGDVTSFENGRQIIRTAFDLGITHFDLANNYGPRPGSAEINFGRILREDFHNHRDEMIISTKAGYGMWDGPYGDGGSKKYLTASLDQSLDRLGLTYVDIFYHHRPDTETPLEETMAALDLLVRQGKALYVGLSNYHVEDLSRALVILERMNTPVIITQPRYSLLDRWTEEEDYFGFLEKAGLGAVVFSPLAQGLLTNRYLHAIPADSRAGGDSIFLKPDDITPSRVEKLKNLDKIAHTRGQSLAQMALAWVLRLPAVTSALVGASRPEQVVDSVRALEHTSFSGEELKLINEELKDF